MSRSRGVSALLLSCARLTAAPTPVRAEQPLWGWADLHAHPASHLSFGADGAGKGGIFWGLPGLALEPSRGTVLTDLPSCPPDKHSGFDEDVVRHKTRQSIIGALDNSTGYGHAPGGAPTFANWPNARSVTHQQMHVTALRRAYDGGLRLMIASATDNELLSALWTRIGYNALGNPVPLPDPAHDFNSAKRQLSFIKELARANPSWMEVAYSSADARRIVASDKLAIILSLELDSLTPAQTLQLVREEGVRHVIPIHLANNAVGGTAIYSDLFNTVNAYLRSTRDSGSWNNLGRDGFFSVEYDARLRGRLGRPQTLVAEGNNLFQGGAIWPREVDDATYATLNYDLPRERGGHKNLRGLSPQGEKLLADLASLGVLIDIAHMSEKSAQGAVDFARSRGYPIMNSHTGVRGADETADNERSLLRAHARAIADLGGVIGLGTEGTSGRKNLVTQPVFPHPGRELIRFTGGLWQRTWQVSMLPGNPAVSALTVTITTGGDDLRGGNNRVWAQVNIAGRVLEVDLSKGATWPNGSVRSVTLPLPAGTRADAIQSFGLRTDPNAKNGPFDTPDNWNVDQLKVDASFAVEDTVGTWVREYHDLLSLLNGRGVALGTDLNGFAPQLAFASDPVSYPITVAQRFERAAAPALPRSTLGGRTYDFRSDGIAHYGMLPDFIAAIREKSNGMAAAAALFQSAGDVVEMWERCESLLGYEGDYNGDGRADLAIWRPQTRDWQLKLSTGGGFTSQIWTGAWASDGPVHVGAFNGAGKSDLLMWRQAGRDWTVNLSTGSGFTFQVWRGAAGSDGPIHLGDFNGDRKTDVMVWRTAAGHWGVNLSTGSGFDVRTWSGLAGGPVHVGDFNGDGKTDALVWQRTTRWWTVNLSTGSGFSLPTWSGAPGSDGPLHVGDFDGDGKSDVMMWRQASRDWSVNLSTGSAFRSEVWRGAPGSDGPREIGDFNGDGKSDIAMWRASTKDWAVNLSTGAGFTSHTWTGAWASDGPVHLGDFNRDGKTDIVMRRPAGSDWTLNLATGTGFTFGVWR